MGNRHHHKKLRAEARARMVNTGESYQKALNEIRAKRTASTVDERSVDLVSVDYFGVAATLATYEVSGRLACMVVSSTQHRGPFPATPLLALATRGRRIVH